MEKDANMLVSVGKRWLSKDSAGRRFRILGESTVGNEETRSPATSNLSRIDLDQFTAVDQGPWLEYLSSFRSGPSLRRGFQC